MTHIVVDSSVFVAALKGGESSSGFSLEVVQRIAQGTLHAYVPLSVLVETVATIRRYTGDTTKAALAAASMQAWPGLVVVEQFERNRLLRDAGRLGLKGMDVFVATLALARALPLLTLDRELRRVASAYVETPALKEVLS